MPKIIVPVGFDAGPLYPMDGDKGSEPDYFEIVNHDRGATLPQDAYTVWLTCFGDPQAHIDLAFTREHLIDLASRADPNAASLVHRLIETGVLLEYDTDSNEALEVLRNYKIYATADGMGSTDEVPELFRIGKLGSVLLEVRHEVYHLWTGAFRHNNMWQAVESYSKHRPADAPFPGAVELGRLFARSIPMLVGARCAHLQPIA